MSEKEEPKPTLKNENKKTEKAPKDLRIPAALVRTFLSSEQTLMSWIRTSLSMITFGFSIAKFFNYLEERQEGSQISDAPEQLGLSLICVGILVVLLAIIEHVLRYRSMKKQGLPADSVSFLPFGSAVALLVIGIAACLGVIF